MPVVPGRGYRQRIAREAAAYDGASASSHLVAELLELWAWGNISTPMVHRISTAAIKAGCERADCRRIARA